MKTFLKHTLLGAWVTATLVMPVASFSANTGEVFDTIVLPPDMEVYKVETLPFQQVRQASPAPQTVTFNRSRFFEASSIETAVTYSELYGPFFSAQYTQRFGPWAALSLLGEGGQNQYRANATVGVQLPAHQLAKVTVDHLGQRMDFNFASQDDTTWVSQTAYGAAYQFLRPHKFLNSLFVNGYWSQAQSKSLSAIRWIADNAEWENDRRIAGGTASTGEMGVKLLPFPRTLIGAAINYSRVQYPEQYNTTDHDDRGIGGQLSLDQMLGSAVKLHLIASDRVPMQHYGVDVDYSPRLLSGNHLALQAGMAYDAGGRGLPNDTKATVSLHYQWGLTPVAAVSAPTPHVVLGADGAPADLMAWTHDPAVKMPQVLAIADQRVRRLRNIVVLALSQNGQWHLPSTALSASQAGSIHISTLRGALDANSVLEQLAKTTDSQGHALSDYITLAVTSDTAQSVTLTATWLPAAQQLKGFDAFSLQVTEDNAESDSASATLTLSHNTDIPLANDVLKTETVLPTAAVQVDYPAKTFTHVDAKTTYKICEVGATSSNQCQTTLDGLSVSGDSEGAVHVKGAAPNKTGTFLHSIIAVNEFGASQPSPNSGVRVKIVVTQTIPIAKDVNLNVKQSVTQPFSTQFPANTFSNVDTKTTYEVCKVGATLSSQCQATVDGLHASLNPDGSVKVSGNAPATVGTTVHSIIAVNEFGASQPSPNGGARVTLVTLVTQNAPSAKDYSTTAGYEAGRHFNVKAIPAGVFSNVDGATQYKLCDWKSDGSMGPCQQNYGDFYAASNPDGSVQFHGTGIEGTGILYDFSVIAITPFGSTTPSKNHGAHIKIAGGPA